MVVGQPCDSLGLVVSHRPDVAHLVTRDIMDESVRDTRMTGTQYATYSHAARLTQYPTWMDLVQRRTTRPHRVGKENSALHHAFPFSYPRVACSIGECKPCCPVRVRSLDTDGRFVGCNRIQSTLLKSGRMTERSTPMGQAVDGESYTSSFFEGERPRDEIETTHHGQGLVRLAPFSHVPDLQHPGCFRKMPFSHHPSRPSAL